MKTKSYILVISGCLALLFLSAFTARAVDLDLAGKVFKPGGKIVVSSTDAVPASLVYTVDLSGTGTSTGSFVPLFGDGDYESALAKIDPGAVSYLHFVLADLSGKIPVTLGVQQGFNEVQGPFVDGTTGTLITKGHVSLKVNKKGIVTASLTGMSFSEKTSAGKKVAFTGAYTLTSGKLSVAPLPATSGTAQPGVISLINTHFCIAGSDSYSSVSPGNANPFRVKHGGSKTIFFILQNNGPSTDDFVVHAGPFPAGFSARFYDGKKDITSQVTASGYPVSALPSGGLKTLKVKLQVAHSVHRGGQATVAFSFARSADSSAVAYGGAYIYTL